MYQSASELLERLFDLKSRGILAEAEYERKKIEILSAAPDLSSGALVPDPWLGHGVSLLVGAVIPLLITVTLLSDDHSSQRDLQRALGAIFLFGLWMMPHSIWLLTQRGSDVVLPVIALATTGFCTLCYAGSL